MDKQKENNLSAIILFTLAYSAWIVYFFRSLNITGDESWGLLVLVPLTNFLLLLLALFIILIGPANKIKNTAIVLCFCAMLANFATGQFLFLNTEGAALFVPSIPILILLFPIILSLKKWFNRPEQ